MASKQASKNYKFVEVSKKLFKVILRNFFSRIVPKPLKYFKGKNGLEIGGPSGILYSVQLSSTLC